MGALRGVEHLLAAAVLADDRHRPACGDCRALPQPVGAPRLVMRPPDAVGADIGRALVLALAADAVIKGVRDKHKSCQNG